jgi:hypothetical protein
LLLLLLQPAAVCAQAILAVRYSSRCSRRPAALLLQVSQHAVTTCIPEQLLLLLMRFQYATPVAAIPR